MVLPLIGAAFAILFVLLLTGTVAGPWFFALPLILVAAFFFVLRGSQRERGGGGLVAPREPTGQPRSSGGGAETANERVGQS